MIDIEEIKHLCSVYRDQQKSLLETDIKYKKIRMAFELVSSVSDTPVDTTHIDELAEKLLVKAELASKELEDTTEKIVNARKEIIETIRNLYSVLNEHINMVLPDPLQKVDMNEIISMTTTLIPTFDNLDLRKTPHLGIFDSKEIDGYAKKQFVDVSEFEATTTKLYGEHEKDNV